MNSIRNWHLLHDSHPNIMQPRRQTHLTDTGDTTALSATVIIITDTGHEKQQQHLQAANRPATTSVHTTKP